MFKNNEELGMTCEKLICEKFNIESKIDAVRVNNNYLIVSKIKKLLIINLDIKIHHGCENKSTDFETSDNKFLSVKTSFASNVKLCPQNIGQTTYKKLNSLFNFENLSSDESKNFKLNILNLQNISNILNLYFNNLMCCDYLFFLDYKRNSSCLIDCEKTKKHFQKFLNDSVKISFTRNDITWNESNTIKINNVSIGEFQIHKNRNCYKFRFNFLSLKKLNIFQTVI
jgi:hypothetical protein